MREQQFLFAFKKSCIIVAVSNKISFAFIIVNASDCDSNCLYKAFHAKI